MSSVRSWPSLGGEKEAARQTSSNGGEVVKMGYLKKLKTMKKKFFVLRGDSAEASARLEYYDTEKKFKLNQAPKRCIILKTCFNINKRSDTRQKWVVALYTKNDCFCLVMDNEEEMEDWLKMLLTLQHGEDVVDGEQPKPTFEHVWHVTVQKKELGHSRNILGPHLLCLTDKTLSLVKPDSDTEKPETIEFSLQSIRRCGDLESFFYMEVGQMSVTGAGNLWMQTEDNMIAQNMHAAIMSACRNCKDIGPMSRSRSHSTNESSRPVSVGRSTHDGHLRWPPHSGLSGVRERCDSLPSRARTTSEGASHIPQHHHRNVYLQPNIARPQSMYNRTISYSPPVIDSSPVSPESRACSTDSAASSLSMEGDGMGMNDSGWEGGPDRYGHSLTPDEPVILEENADECENVHWHPSDDYVGPDKTMCLTINNHICHKNSPNLSYSGFKSSSPSQGSLPDMCSPCGSSPLESSYLPMSPGDKPTTGCNNYSGGLRAAVSGGSSSVNHSRDSSIAEEYVHMAPMQDDGYVDMGLGSGGRHRRPVPDHFRSGELSPASNGSVTSGTPSTDIRFSEYTLEKVSTFFNVTPSEEEIVPSERPARAYSVGSRPTFNKRNEIPQSECQQRVRAFSVGSRCPRLHSAHLTPPPRLPLSSSHSSVEPSEDLMELDFTKNDKSRKRSYSKKISSSERLSVPPSSVASSAASSYSTAEGSYMEISPRSSPKPPASDNEIDTSHFCPSPPKNNRIYNFIGRSPPKSHFEMKPSSSPPVSGFSSFPLYKVPEGDYNYVDMTSGTRGDLIAGASPPSIRNTLRDERNHPLADGPYLEMHPIETKSVFAKSSAPRVDSFPVTETFKQNSLPKNSFPPPIKPALISTSDLLKAKPGSEDYLEMNAKRKISVVEDTNSKICRTNPIDTPKQTPDGYVEMTLGSSKPVRKSSMDNYRAGESDYMNVSGGVRRDRNVIRNDRNRYSSQPIAIQSTASSEQASSSSPVYTFVGRKHSTGTPPKVPSYLPLGNCTSSSPSSSPYSSLGRRPRKPTSRRESRELSSSGSSTPIFPLSLNSPSSPMKPFAQTNANVKEKDGYDSAAKCPVDATSGTVRISYSEEQPLATAQSRPTVVEHNEYVNYNPLIPALIEETSDYTPMKPVNPMEPSRKISAPSILNSAKSKPVERIVTGMSDLTLSSPEISSVPTNNFSNSSGSFHNINCAVTSGNKVADKINVETVATRAQLGDGRSSSQSTGPANSCVVPSRSSGSCRVTIFNCNAVPTASLSSATCSTTAATTTVTTAASFGQNETVTTTSNTANPAATSIVRELHYASLDLDRSNSVEETNNNDPVNRSLRNQSSTSSASTPSPNINQTSTPAFLYAEIDFTKSSCNSNSNTEH